VEEGEDLRYSDTPRDLWRGAWEASKPGVAKEILTVDRYKIHGNISYSSKTWHFKIFESADSPKLPNLESWSSY
jgi:hypothetical protein